MDFFLFVFYSGLLCSVIAQDVGTVGEEMPLPPPAGGTTATDVSSSVPSLPPTGLFNWLNVGSNMLKNKLSYSAETLKKALGIGNSTAQVAASLGSDIAKEGTNYVKQGVQTATTIGLKGIDNGVGLANQVLELVERVPGMNIVSGVGKMGVNMAQGLGKNALNAVNRFEDTKLNFINQLAQRGSSALASLANAGTGLGQRVITSGANAINGGIDTGMNVMNQILKGFTSLASLGNSLSSTLATAKENLGIPRNIMQFPQRH